jgi:hypothetical protein
MPQSSQNTYQLKITLNGTKPPIWRSFLVQDSISLPDLHHALQIIMGWTDSHLHQFGANGRWYGEPDEEFESDMLDEREITLRQLVKKKGDLFIYEYDFGDGWEHNVVLEKILPFDPKDQLPQCLKGKGACPPEDVGGVWGYQEFLTAIKDRNHPEHRSYTEWIGGHFDSALFDLEEVNQLLRESGKQ